jgi:uncharacterized surface anchored protein
MLTWSQISFAEVTMRLLPLALAVFIIASPSRAQEVTATIVVTVVDSSGSAIPAATVTIISTDRNEEICKITTGAEGDFVATLLPIGKYLLRAERSGFKTAVRDGIELHVNDKLSFHLEMQVGQMTEQITEQITVEAEAVTVDLQTVTAEGLVSGTEMTELSLNNRNFVQLLSLMLGVTSNADTDEIITSANYGHVTSARDARRVQLGLKVNF